MPALPSSMPAACAVAVDGPFVRLVMNRLARAMEGAAEKSPEKVLGLADSATREKATTKVPPTRALMTIGTSSCIDTSNISFALAATLREILLRLLHIRSYTAAGREKGTAPLRNRGRGSWLSARPDSP